MSIKQKQGQIQRYKDNATDYCSLFFTYQITFTIQLVMHVSFCYNSQRYQLSSVLRFDEHTQSIDIVTDTDCLQTDKWSGFDGVEISLDGIFVRDALKVDNSTN